MQYEPPANKGFLSAEIFVKCFFVGDIAVIEIVVARIDDAVEAAAVFAVLARFAVGVCRREGWRGLMKPDFWRSMSGNKSER